MTHYKAGAPYHPGTAMPSNVTSECPHRHRTPGGALMCIARADRAIKRGHGPSAYSDRVVIEVADDGRRTVWENPS